MIASSGSNGPRNPCMANCCLDEADICLGCHRSYDEILAWHTMNDAEKQALVDRLKIRAQQRKSY